MSIDRLRANYPVRFRQVFFPLHPETPPEGKSLAELFAGRDIEPMQARMRDLMSEAGLEYGTRTHTYNSRLAQELGKWADTQPGGEALHSQIYSAYFVEGLNLADTDVLVRLAQRAGLDPVEASRVLVQREFREAVNSDWQLAESNGITGVPALLANNLIVVGCQPYQTLERFVQHLLSA